VAAGGDVVDGERGEGRINLCLGEGRGGGGNKRGLCRVEVEGQALFVVGEGDGPEMDTDHGDRACPVV